MDVSAFEVIGSCVCLFPLLGFLKFCSFWASLCGDAVVLYLFLSEFLSDLTAL